LHLSHKSSNLIYKIIKKALKPLGEDSFIKLMIDKHWIESDVRENKVGGAFFVSLPNLSNQEFLPPI